MKIVVPPIKSQGIKTKLVPWIQTLVPKVSGKWIEPFLGTHRSDTFSSISHRVSTKAVPSVQVAWRDTILVVRSFSRIVVPAFLVSGKGAKGLPDGRRVGEGRPTYRNSL